MAKAPTETKPAEAEDTRIQKVSLSAVNARAYEVQAVELSKKDALHDAAQKAVAAAFNKTVKV